MSGKPDSAPSSLELLKTQRSHILVVLSNASADRDEDFRGWYQGAYRDAVSSLPKVLSVRNYERHPVDVTRGRFEPLPFQYFGLCELSVDGAEAAQSVVERVTELHLKHPAAEAPATWLYYPACERVGRDPVVVPSLLTVAFANGVPGQEDEFREWYPTRHIRHAMNLPALVSGQCLQRTLFQLPGAMEARFNTIAVYEQEGTMEELIESFGSIPPGTLSFPSMDLDPSRFAESSYRPC